MPLLNQRSVAIAGLLAMAIILPARAEPPKPPAPAATVGQPAYDLRAPMAVPPASLPATVSDDIRAQLKPLNYTTLAAEIAAKINRIPVPEGGAFKKGDALVEFDCAQQAAQLDEAKALVTAARRTRDVSKRLVELNSGGMLEANTAMAEAARAEARERAAQVVISKCSVAAPFAGRIVEQKVREQQYVQPGAPLMEILDDSALEVEFIAPSSWLTWLKPGANFDIEVTETAKTYPASVTRLGAKVDAVSHSVKIYGAIKGSNPGLLAGMSGKIKLSPP